jgi:hypothetical protein
MSKSARDYYRDFQFHNLQDMEAVILSTYSRIPGSLAKLLTILFCRYYWRLCQLFDQDNRSCQAAMNESVISRQKSASTTDS